MLRLLSKPRRLNRPSSKSVARNLSASASPVGRRVLTERHNAIFNRNSTVSRIRFVRDKLQDPQDISKWVDLLAARYRIYGPKGIETTWWDLRQSGVDLPVQGGKEIVKLWRDFLEHDRLRGSVLSYAFDLRLRTGQVYSELYSLVMSKILSNPDYKAQKALKMHDVFKRNYVINPKSLVTLAASAVKTDHGLNTFKKIYRRCLGIPGRKTYDKIVPALCERGEWRLALEWHKFLLSNGDTPLGPTPIKELHLVRPDLAAYYDKFQPMPSTYQAKTITIEDKASSPALEDSAHGFLDVKLPSATANIDPLSDHICARLFATRSFSIRFII